MSATASLHRHAWRAMGSPCEVVLWSADRHAVQRATAAVVADVERLEARYSRYRDDSLLAAINAVAARGGSLEVDAETAHLVDYAQACWEQSDGLFDISSGLLRQAWKFTEGARPDPAAIASLLPRVGWDKVRWAQGRLEFTVAGMELDLGGAVKEYAADRAAALCRANGVGSGMVNLGGDIAIVGPREDGAPWRIGINDPRRPGELAETLELHRGGVATSGDYERCTIVDGVRYGHILNPRTGWPTRHLASVTVVADLCVVAGSAATIAMLKDREGPHWLAELGAAHSWIDVHGERGGTGHAPSTAEQG